MLQGGNASDEAKSWMVKHVRLCIGSKTMASLDQRQWYNFTKTGFVKLDSDRFKSFKSLYYQSSKSQTKNEFRRMILTDLVSQCCSVDLQILPGTENTKARLVFLHYHQLNVTKYSFNESICQIITYLACQGHWFHPRSFDKESVGLYPGLALLSPEEGGTQ